MAAPEHPAVARVLLDTPLPQLDHLFDYRIPEELRASVVPGVRVRVPLRMAGRIADAYVVETAATSDVPGELSAVEALVSEQRVLTPEVYALARSVADRAAGSASDVLRLAIPKRQVRVEKAWRDGRRPPEPETRPAAVPVTGYGAELDLTPGDRVAVDGLTGVVRLGDSWVGAWAVTLAELAVREVAAGRSAILALPDYRDQDQVEAALAAVAGGAVVLRLDARQSNAERYASFLSALEDRPCIVVGNRSAVYAPVARLGLIALWNDGDSLFAEPLAPYVHARDAALVRQEQSGCSLVLLSLSRSAATQRLVELGWLRAVSPPKARTPAVVLTPDDAGSPRIPQAAWRAATEALVLGPVLLQVARPGNAALDALKAGTPMAADAGRTAHDLARAFPGVRVQISDGERPLERVTDERALIIATRGPSRSRTAATRPCCCSTGSACSCARARASRRTACGGGRPRLPRRARRAGAPRRRHRAARPRAGHLAAVGLPVPRARRPEAAPLPAGRAGRDRHRPAAPRGAPARRGAGRRRDRGQQRARRVGRAHRAALRLRARCGGGRRPPHRDRPRGRRPACPGPDCGRA
ncbi:primosomal protein N' [Naasia aerilata]|uniref:Primosomal protein N' 3' DNA-binding domain-containing protein n=1 Tax=Naasia aerilata TaxID=1162966 RepID=A0ABM8GF82_9MICO|nr:hypothetical protein GCM10025866_28920 [Naasia aerilata]